MAQPLADHALRAVEVARLDVNRVKNVARMLDVNQPATKQIIMKVQQAELELQQAERLVERSRERLKATNYVLPRARETLNPAEAGKRALAAFQEAPPLSTRPEGAAPEALLQEQQLPLLLSRLQAASSTPLTIERLQDDGLRLQWPGQFQAGVWFERRGDAGLAPEITLVFAWEDVFTRWRTSSHVLFRVLTERAQAALHHYWTTESDAQRALERYVEWLALHRNVYDLRSSEDGRRLAFDASRGAFLPPCVIPFESGADGSTQFHPRSSIPTRSDTERASPQT